MPDEPASVPLSVAPVEKAQASPLSYRTQQVIDRLRIERSAECTVVTVLPRWSALVGVTWPLIVHAGWLIPLFAYNQWQWTRPDQVTCVFVGLAFGFALVQVIANLVSHFHPQRWEIRRDSLTLIRRTITKIDRQEFPRVIIMYVAAERVRNNFWPRPFHAVAIHFIHGNKLIALAGTKTINEAFVKEITDMLDCPEPPQVRRYPNDRVSVTTPRSILPNGFAISIYPRKIRWGSALLAILFCVPACALLANYVTTSHLTLIPEGKNAVMGWVFSAIFSVLGIAAVLMLQHKLSRTTHLTVNNGSISLMEESVWNPCNVSWPISSVREFKIEKSPVRCIRLKFADGQAVDILKGHTASLLEWVYGHLAVEDSLRRIDHPDSVQFFT